MMRIELVFFLAAGVTLAGCGEPRATAEEAAAATAATQVDLSVPVSSGFDRAKLPELPPNIYYDLTRYEWYAQGKPLIHEGLGYQPEGMPVALELANLTRAGEFEGVDYYVPKAPEAHGQLYVPVFEGYWLPFVSAAPPGLPASE